MSKNKGTNNLEVSKLASLMSSSRKKFKEEIRKYDKNSIDKLYFAISTEIIQAISNGNIKDFEKLIKLIEYINSSGDKFQEDFHCGIDKLLASSNFVILACKYTQVIVLEYVFNNPNVLNLFKRDSQSFVKVDDIDDNGHNAFYYAIRSGDCKLVETLVKKWPHEYFRVSSEDFSDLLARSYEELKLKYIALSDEMKIQVESLIIDYRFYSDSSKSKNKIIKISHEDINRRIDLVNDNIELLLQEYLTASLNDKFFYIARFIAQNIHILKRQLKATYNKLPWEEIEFCIIAFLSNNKKYNTHTKVIQNIFVTKKKLLNYLKVFGNLLEKEKNNINHISVKQLSTLPNKKNNRDVIVTAIIENNPELKELYENYQLLRDMHSLEIMNHYLDLAVSTNPDECEEGQLTIIRSLQIMGEYLKNTLESPKMSTFIANMLLLSLPTNIRKLIIKLRDSLLHGFSESQIELQTKDISNSYLFKNIQQDLKVLNLAINNVIYRKRHQLMIQICNEFIKCKTADQINNLLESFNDFNLKSGRNDTRIDDYQQIMHCIQELNNIMNRNNIEDHSLKYVTRLINEEFPCENNTFNYDKNVLSSENIRKTMNRRSNVSNNITTLHGGIKQLLSNIPKKVDGQTCRRIRFTLLLFFSEIKWKLSKNDRLEADDKISQILYRIELDFNDLKWIEEIADKLNEKNNNHVSYVNMNADDSSKLMEKYTVKMSMLRVILNNYQFDNFICYRNNEKLQAAVEILVLEILSILKESDINVLSDDKLFLDNYSPILIGKSLRNYLAHGNDIIEVLQFDPSALVFLNAKKLMQENILGNRKVGELVESHLDKVIIKYEEGLKIVADQEEMFRALEEGDLEKLKEVIKKGADITGKNIRSWTALHFAAKGPNIEVVEFVLDQNVSTQSKNDSNQSALHIAAEYGRKSTVELLIKNGYDVNAADNSEKTALHIAAENGHEEIVKILIQNNADTYVQDKVGFGPLHTAISANHISIVKILLELECHVDFNVAWEGFTALHLASEFGHIEIVKHLIEKKGNVNAKSYRKCTPIHAAAVNGHFEVVKLLLLHGAEIDAECVRGSTVLFCAVQSNHEKMVEFLLQQGVNINHNDSTFYAPIINAAERGNLSMLKLLLKFNADVNTTNPEGNTPLHYAALNGHLDIVETLIENGAINLTNHKYVSPLELAVSKGHSNAVEFLLKKGASLQTKHCMKFTPLHTAVILKNKKCVELLLKYSNNEFTNYTYEKSVLHLSSKAGCLDITGLLISKGFNVNEQDSNGWTPLHDAVGSGEVKIVKMLIEANANVNILTLAGSSPLRFGILNGYKEISECLIYNKSNMYCKIHTTALHFALQCHRQEIAKILIENGAPLNDKDTNGLTPLQIAAQNNLVDAVKLLLKHGALVEYADKGPINLAVMEGCKNVVKVLFDYVKIDVNQKFSMGYTLLHIAVVYNRLNIVNFLLDKKADINSRTDFGETPLALAVCNGNIDIVKLLLSKKADSSICNKNGFTLISLAVDNGHIEILKLLWVYDKVDVNCKIKNKMTLLHLAACRGNLPITEFLIEKGADINAKSVFGLKPFHCGAICGYTNIIEYYVNKNVNMYDHNKYGLTLLHFATMGKKKDVVNYLIGRKFDVNIINSFGQTPLHLVSTNLSVDIGELINSKLDNNINEDIIESFDISQLHQDSDNSSEEIVEILLSNGAAYNPTDKDDFTPSDRINNPRIVYLFDCIDELFKAVRKNDITRVKHCIEKNVIINAINRDQVTALHYAAWKGYIEIAEILLINGANPNISDKNGSTPLQFAAKFGYLEIVKILLFHGAIYNAKINKNNTPLELATHLEIIKLLSLIHHSFDSVKNQNIHIVDDLNRIGSIDCTHVKAVMNARNIDNKTLTVYAIHQNFPDVNGLFNVLQENNQSSLHLAALLKNSGKYHEALKIHQEILDKRRKILGIDDPGILEIKLQIASYDFYTNNYQAALDKVTEIYEKQKNILGADNANTLATNSRRATTLFKLRRIKEASILFKETYEKQKEILDAYDENLLVTQIDMCNVLTSLEKYDQALLHYTDALHKTQIICGENSIQQLAVKNNIGAVYTIQGNYDKALEIYEDVFESRKRIQGPNHPDTLKAVYNKIELLTRQKKYSEALEAGEKLLISQTKVIGSNHIDTLMTKFLIGEIHYSRGTSFDALKTYVSICEPITDILGPDHPTVQDLTKRIEGIRLNYHLRGEDDILKYWENKIEISKAVETQKSIEALLINGVDINSQDSKGFTLLHYAVNNQDENIVKFLLKNNADCCSLSNKGNTALHFATIKNNKDIVCILLEHAKQVLKSSELHGFINAKTISGGVTCMHVAAQKGFEDIVEILLKNGAIYNSINFSDKKTPCNLCNNNNIKQLLKSIDEFFVDARNGSDELIIKIKRFDVTKYSTILNARNTNGETLVNVALSNKYKSLAFNLLKIFKNNS